MKPRHAITVTAQPAVEPVTLAAAKLHCKVDHAADDALFAGSPTQKGWIRAAREMVEEASGRKLLTQTVRVDLGGFPCGSASVELPVWPVQAVTGVSYKRASDGADTALTGFQAWLSHDPPLLGPPVADGYWPAADGRYLNPVSVTLTAGDIAAANVPGHAVQAILLTVGYWHGFRGDGRDPAAAESIPGEAGLPAGAVRLIDLIRRKGYA